MISGIFSGRSSDFCCALRNCAIGCKAGKLPLPILIALFPLANPAGGGFLIMALTRVKTG